MKLYNYSIKLRLLKVRRKLKSSGISLQEDLTARNRALLKKTAEHPKITSAWSIDGRIYGLIKSTNFSDTKRRISGHSDLNKL